MNSFKKFCLHVGKNAQDWIMRGDVMVSTHTKLDEYGVVNKQKLAYHLEPSRSIDRSAIDRLLDHPATFFAALGLMCALAIVGVLWPCFELIVRP